MSRPASKLREMANGVENRLRGVKRYNRYPLVILMVFMVLVALTTFISIYTAWGFNIEDSDENGGPFSTWKKVLQRTEAVGKKPTDPYTPMLPTAESSSGWPRNLVNRLPGVVKEETFYCERYHIRSDVCHMHGTLQLERNSSVILYAVDKKTQIGEEVIQPYTRKWEKFGTDRVAKITLKSQTKAKSTMTRRCQIEHDVPAVLFSTGGYTGNVYHEYNDGLIPLFITAQHLKGEVVFGILDYQEWWMVRYREVIQQLSNYNVIDVANNTLSYCFSDVTVGLYVHDELGIDQSLMLNHESIQDFRALLSKAYPYEGDWDWDKEFPKYGTSVQSKTTGSVPQLVIMNREGSRAIINLDQVIELAVRVGFNVTVMVPDPYTEMKKMFWLLDRCDVLIGVHGAALTHFLFMRPGTVFIQIVPLGTEWAAKTYYGDPAIRLGLHYVEYKITVGESTLSSEYEKNDPILVNPNAVGQQGWSVVKEIYLTKQKVELSLPRFYKILVGAKAKMRPFMKSTGG
ncbi:unnamed protein product [Calypogeia fissa]